MKNKPYRLTFDTFYRNCRKTSARSIKSIEDTLAIFEHQELSLKQAIELASTPALKWDKNAQFYRQLILTKISPGRQLEVTVKENTGILILECQILIKYF